ncbi:MAG: glycosyl hydrolase family 65 protein [Candidatus Aminicenantes bacterium]
MNIWVFSYDGFDPGEEKLREALCATGNGYFVTRGAAPESSAGEIHYPGTYLAGGYNRLKTKIKGQVIENEDLVNMPNWLTLTFRINGGKWFSLSEADILSYRQDLDMRKGILQRSIRFQDEKGQRTRLKEHRFVHMANHHLAGLHTALTSENWSGTLEIRSALDGRVINDGVKRYRDLNSKHLDPVRTESKNDIIHLKVQTNQSLIQISQSARTRVQRNGETVSPDRTVEDEPGYIAHHLKLDVSERDTIEIEKIISLYTSRDRAISEPSLESMNEIKRASDFENLLLTHIAAWEELWDHYAIDIDLSPNLRESRQEQILHLYTFHLLQTCSLHTRDMDVGVPARGWHGEAYRGHIFWDELFIFPILTLRTPEITRSLLMYRYRRLNEARRMAKKAGYRGAMYPWQSGSDGREESQVLHLNPKSGNWIPDNSNLQRHVNAAIIYNLWHYYQVNNDLEFLTFYASEVILEVARFFASLTEYNKDLDRYEIKGVMGPDEYHDGYPWSDQPGLDNNAYTNVMAVWVINRALEVLSILDCDRRRDLCRRMDLCRDEILEWKRIRSKMRVVFLDDNIIAPFEGYDKLEEFDWEGYQEKYGDIQRLDRILEAEEDTPNRYKASKQADVLMLFYLFSAEELTSLFKKLGYDFSPDMIPKNIEYYMRRTSHGSTLSRVVHSWVMARSDRAKSWDLFNEALKSDVADIQGGTTPEGIHLGAMAGTIDLIQRCYTGIWIRNDILWINPDLPKKLMRLKMKIYFLGHSLRLEITQKKMTIQSLKSPSPPIKIGINQHIIELATEEKKEIELPFV